MNCPKCGAEIKELDRFCGRCGVRLGEDQEQGPQGQGYQTYEQPQGVGVNYQQPPYPPVDIRKSRVIAGVLQIFLGWAGVGRFYLGYNGIAIAQLIVCIFTCGIGSIWPFIDGILILANQVPTDANGIPLKD